MQVTLGPDNYQYAFRMSTIRELIDLSQLKCPSARANLQKRITMFGKLTRAQIEELLEKQIVGRIGCHANGITYVVPVSYAYDGEYIYVRSLEGMKLGMMRKNPEVCFEVDNTRNLTNWQSVVAWGLFQELPAGKEREHAVRCLGERKLPVLSSETMHLSPQWPFPVENESEVQGIIFRIRLMQKSGRYEKSDNNHYFAS
jgi:nitroimidazol reductase NimA-like FMN-containing flavoprotein (pyridoxamine 5'-phosphate oxidase superfamily)